MPKQLKPKRVCAIRRLHDGSGHCADASFRVQPFPMKTILHLLLALLAGTIHAQPAPYDTYPPADPPYYRVLIPASKAEGELMFAANYTVWIPPTAETLRGVIVHQHGCGEGSCKSGLTGAYDLHWQALAKKHDCALLAPSYAQPQEADCQMWCDPRYGSDAAFRKALVALGKASDHPELAEVPWALWGHSGGGHWAGGMVMLHPERVAAAWLRSGVPFLNPNPDRPSIQAHKLPDAALKVPIMCNPGTKEGFTVKEGRFSRVWPANETFLHAIRSRGGLIGVAIDPLSSHECGNQRYMAIRWFDAILSARLPERSGYVMKPMPVGNAWLATIGETEAVPEAAFQGDRSKSIWLPDAATAKAWSHYVKDTTIPDTTPPPAPHLLDVRDDTVSWVAEADLESGLAHFIIERGGKEIATVPENPKNRFGRPVFQGLQYSDTPTQPLVKMTYRDTTPGAGKGEGFRVIAVNTAGLRSDEYDWPVYLGGKQRNLYSPLTQINRDNVSRLKVAWTYDTGDKAEYQANNLVVRGVLYTPTQSRKVVALDAATGEVQWIWDPAKEKGIGKGPARQRGLVYWENAQGGQRRIFTGVRNRLIALDPRYRKEDSEFRRERFDRHGHRLEHARCDLRRFAHRGREGRSGVGALVRRSYRRTALDLSPDSAARRVRLRYLAAGGLEVGDRHHALVRSVPRRGAGHCLRRHQDGGTRFRRRKKTWRQPVREQPGRFERQNGKAHLALPDCAPRFVGQRSALSPGVAHGDPRREED